MKDIGHRRAPACVLVAAVALAGCCHVAGTRGAGLGFFVTSAGSGRGGDLGGLEGADRRCQALATAVGAGGHTWRAYLSTQAQGGRPAVDARDRIGTGPWRNAHGDLVAQDLAELHGGAGHLTKSTALTEAGATVGGVGDPQVLHDILTGSRPDGSAVPVAENATCGNWTQAAGGGAMVGHHDRHGLDGSAAAASWNSSHRTLGCSPDELRQTGGAGLFYCFAAD